VNDLYLPSKLKSLLAGQTYVRDSVGMSSAGVLFFPDKVLKIQPESAESRTEHIMMRWLAPRLTVPECLYHTAENGVSYLLMSRLGGRMACDAEYLRDPVRLTRILADILRQMWQIDITDCPVRWGLDEKLAAAKIAVERGEVDTENVEAETFGEGGFRDPAHLLAWLEGNRPEEDFVFSHGDFCPENIFLDGESFGGLIDLGRAGAADRWQDIALCRRSLRYMFAGFDADLLFEMLEIEPDRQKLRYYTLLDELF